MKEARESLGWTQRELAAKLPGKSEAGTGTWRVGRGHRKGVWRVEADRLRSGQRLTGETEKPRQGFPAGLKTEYSDMTAPEGE